MLYILNSFKPLFLNLLIWLLLGIALNMLAIPIIALHVLYLYNKKNVLEIFLGFFFILLLSDSRNHALDFAKNLKVVLMVLLFLPFVLSKQSTFGFYTNYNFSKPFIPFITFAFFCIIFSPVPFTAVQKTISYFLLPLIVPIIFYSLYKAYGDFFLKAVVYLGASILVAGYVMFLVNPSLVIYFGGGRSSGVLGNPNGLGMFCFLFFMLYFVIQHYFPDLFTKKEKIIILFLIFSSLLWSGSRGQTLSLLIFLATQYMSKRNKAVGLLLSAAIGIMLVTIDIDIVAIAQALGFEEYLRVETLQQGGGRVVAREFAFEQIQKNFWIGKGFSYTEYIYGQNYLELSMRGHEGNAHNAFLTVWLDTGFIGLLLFMLAWGILFLKASKNSYLAFPVALAVMASNMVESWLIGSLNPFTIQLLMILTLLIYIIKDAPPAGKHQVKQTGLQPFTGFSAPAKNLTK